jgi:hypothetical protein
MFTNVSEEPVTSIFREDDYAAPEKIVIQRRGVQKLELSSCIVW